MSTCTALLLLLAPLATSQQPPPGLRDAMADLLYRVEAVPGGLGAANPAHQLFSTFAPDRVELEGEGWRVGLRLAAWGRADALAALEPVEPRVDGRRVEYRRSGIVEWYVNAARGLEQGFTVAEAPAGTGPLQLVLAVDGELAVEVLPDGRDARFAGADGVLVHYAGLRAWDARGRELVATLSPAPGGLRIEVADGGATYPVVVDPWIGTQVALLTGSAALPGGQLGSSCAVAGDTAVVGAVQSSTGNGEAYVFRRDQGGADSWGEVARLVASDGQFDDRFGSSVAVSGDTILVGAPQHFLSGVGSSVGAVYVFERDQGGPAAWGEVKKLTASTAALSARFGCAVAVDGDTGLVGSYGDGWLGGFEDGAAFVLERDQGGADNWGEVARITASNASGNEVFGWAVGLSGDAAVVGAPGPQGIGAGAAFVFERDAGGPNAWGEVGVLTASDAAVGDFFGLAVAIGADTALVGAPYNSVAGSTNAGAAYVYARDQGGAGAWGEVRRLTAATPALNQLVGHGVSLSGIVALVGAPGGNGYAGEALAFERDRGGSGNWGALPSFVPPLSFPGDFFGNALASDAETLVLGSYGRASNTGAAYVYELEFDPEPYCTAGTSALGCRAGVSALGQASASSPAGFVLVALDLEGAKNGIFFFGTSGRQANPWGNGTSYQCVVPPVRRVGLSAPVGTPGLCNGGFSVDLNGLWCPTCTRPALNPGEGTYVQAQLWYRDPLSTSNQTTSLSNAIEFLVGP